MFTWPWRPTSTEPTWRCRVLPVISTRKAPKNGNTPFFVRGIWTNAAGKFDSSMLRRRPSWTGRADWKPWRRRWSWRSRLMISLLRCTVWPRNMAIHRFVRPDLAACLAWVGTWWSICRLTDWLIFVFFLQMTTFIEDTFFDEQTEDIKQIANYVGTLRKIGSGLGEFEFDFEILRKQGELPKFAAAHEKKRTGSAAGVERPTWAPFRVISLLLAHNCNLFMSIFYAAPSWYVVVDFSGFFAVHVICLGYSPLQPETSL